MLTWFAAIVILMLYRCVKRLYCVDVINAMGWCCITDVILVWCWCDNNVLLIWCCCDTDVMSMWYRCRLDVITIGVSMSDRFVVRCCETLNPPTPTTSLSPVGWSYRYIYKTIPYRILIIGRLARHPKRPAGRLKILCMGFWMHGFFDTWLFPAYIHTKGLNKALV